MFENTKYQYLKGKIIIYLPKCRSTNTELLHKVKSDPQISEILALYTDEQTQGRGQRDNVWTMTSGKQLAISVLLPLDSIDEKNLVWLPMYVTYSLASLLELCKPDLKIQIKWPNDLYLQDKKIGGILCETVKNKLGAPFCVVGLGINLCETPDLKLWNASSLEAAGLYIDKYKTMDLVMKAVDQAAVHLLSPDDHKKIVDAIHNRLMYLGKEIYSIDSEGNVLNGIFKGIDAMGRFIVDTNRNTVRLPHHIWSSPKLKQEYRPAEV